MAVYTDRAEPVNQGDLFADIPFVIPRGDDREREDLVGMVISHDCDCDKFFTERDRGRLEHPDRFPITMAPVFRVEELQGGQDGDARAGRIRRFFYLPPEDEREDLVVDLWFEQPVAMTQLLDRDRMASLSDEYVQRLHIQLWELRTRVKAATFLGSSQ